MRTIPYRHRTEGGPELVTGETWHGSNMAAAFFGAIVSATDLLPPPVRYGYVHRVTRMLFGDELPRVPAALGMPILTDRSQAAARTDVTCALATLTLDGGGVGSVIEMLAGGLASLGVRPVVICEREGERSRRLREHGVEVISVSAGGAGEAVRAAGADVIQLHSAPPHLEQAALESGLPLVPVLHNTEIHFTKARWASFADLVQHSQAVVAVSEVVREFHVRHLPAGLADKFTVIANGAPAFPAPGPDGRRKARRALEDALGVPLRDSVVFVSLARYDAQKNISGLVAGFLRAAATTDQTIHLVVAGDPWDWAEVRRASGIRRRSPVGGRVHLLGNSDARTVLAAGDVFVLDSFFEGWPVAATEATVAGLPLLLSDVGGARELVARDPRSVLIPNACGPAGEVTDAKAAAARRRSDRQANHDQLVAAIKATAAAVRSAAHGEPLCRAATAASAASLDVMAASHARVIRTAVAARGECSADPVAAKNPIVYMAGVEWDAVQGTDRHLAIALSRRRPVIWIDPPQSLVQIRRRGYTIPTISSPTEGITRLSVTVLPGASRPGLRTLANRRLARHVRSYLRDKRIRPAAVIAATPEPMLAELAGVPGQHIYLATDDFVAAASLWRRGEYYLNRSRERNLRAADIVLAVTQELADDLRRGQKPTVWFPNGADLERFKSVESAAPAPGVTLSQPIAGVVGQFNDRTDLDILFAVHDAGISLLLVGPTHYADEHADRFSQLTRLANVEWVDQVAHDQLPGFYRAMTVGLTAYGDSMFNRRSFPLKTVEYLAAGLPVVSTDAVKLAGLDSPFVRNTHTKADFVAAVRQFLKDAPRADEVRKTVAGYSWNSRAAEVLQLIECCSAEGTTS